jgi:hypothetical protein
VRASRDEALWNDAHEILRVAAPILDLTSSRERADRTRCGAPRLDSADAPSRAHE